MLAAVFLLPCGLMTTGCSGHARLADQREENDPLIRRARAKKRLHDIDGAIDLYNEALQRKPDLARAHLELGVLYENHRTNYLSALYHYRRYLELRPDTEKRELIEGVIDSVRVSFAASLPEKSSASIREIARLQTENNTLRGQLEKLTEENAQQETVVTSEINPPPQTPAGTRDTPQNVRAVSATQRTLPNPKPPQPAVRRYVVRTGDTLSAIARKVYSDPEAWRAIAEANNLENPSSLRVGKTLIIPRRNQEQDRR